MDRMLLPCAAVVGSATADEMIDAAADDDAAAGALDGVDEDIELRANGAGAGSSRLCYERSS
jgi:hypothetical protein